VVSAFAALTPQTAKAVPSASKAASLAELLTAFERVAVKVERSIEVQTDYQTLVTDQKLQTSAALYHDYVRVRLVFESVREGGLWHFRWAITRQPPSSMRLWQQLGRVSAVGHGPLAVGECDELSAMFAFLLWRLEVKNVALIWPVQGHCVAVWSAPTRAGKTARIIVPTSQVLLDDNQSLGTLEFDAWRQKRIYPYRRNDVPRGFQLPLILVTFFIGQLERYGFLRQKQLQHLRNQRVSMWVESGSFAIQ